MQKNLILWAIGGLLLAATAAIAIYKSWSLLFPVIHLSAPLDNECDLRAGPCLSPLPEGGSVSLSIEPRSIPVVKPLQFEVRLQGMQAERVEIDFSGVDMNMGFNRPSLERHQGGVFVGKGMLPVCVRDAMEWEARVLLHTDQGLVSAPYRFITVKPGMERPQ